MFWFAASWQRIGLVPSCQAPSGEVGVVVVSVVGGEDLSLGEGRELLNIEQLIAEAGAKGRLLAVSCGLGAEVELDGDEVDHRDVVAGGAVAARSSFCGLDAS